MLPHGGTAAAVEDGVSGIVAADGRAYVRALERLAADPELRARLAEGAMRHARAAHSPEATGARWRRVYEELMGNPKRPRSAGARASGAQRFAAGVGELAGDGDTDLDRALPTAIPAVVESDGGVLDYRRAYRDDPRLRLWSGIGLLARERPALAAGELAAALRLGCPRERVQPWLDEASEALGQPVEVTV